MRETHKFFIFATVLDSDVRLAVLVEHLERKVFDVRLDFGVGKFPADETLSVENTWEDRELVNQNVTTYGNLTCCGGSLPLDSSRHHR